MKKHIHHFSRGMIIGLELLGLAAVAIFAAWLLLIIRLSQGPMNVDFLTRTIEKSLNDQKTGFEFSVESTLLTWGGATEPFEFEVNRVRVSRADKTPVLSIRKIGIQLSKRQLVFGVLAPRVIKIYSPILRIIRSEDGRFSLNMSDEELAAEPEAAGAAPDTMSQSDFVQSLIIGLNDTGALSVLAGLEKIAITDASIFYDDRILNAAWRSKGSSVTFARGRGGLLVDAIANVGADQAHMASVRASFYYNWQTLMPNGVIHLTGFSPALLAQGSERLKDFSGIEMPLKGSISFAMDQDFNLGYGRFALGADTGKFNALGLYANPVPIQAFYAQGWFNAATREAGLEQLHVETDGPKLDAKAEVKRLAGEGGGHAIHAKALLQNMPLDRLKEYWPEALAPDPRKWVTGHLSAGTATKATLELAMLAPQGDFGALQLQKLDGQIAFNGIKVDYFSPLMPVTEVSGLATYDQKSFSIDVNGGVLGDMRVTKSKVDITDLDIQDEKTHSKIDINATLNGPLRTALQVLDSEPLQYPQKLGIRAAEVGGNADVGVNFKFPLHEKLDLPEVAVTAQARLSDVRLKGIAAGLDLTGGPLEVTLKDSSLAVKGSGRLDAMPIEFSWFKDFAANTEISSKVEARLALDAAALAKFGVPGDLKMRGVLPANVTYMVANDNTATLLLKSDITPAAFTLPAPLDYEKKEASPGSLELFLRFSKEGVLSAISGLNLQTDAALLKGDIELGSDGKSLRKLNFSQVRLGDTDIAVEAYNGGADGYNVKVTGRQFDASALLAGNDKPNSDAEAAKPVAPLTVSMAVDRLLTGKEKHIEQVKMFMRRNGWSRIEQMEMDGISGGQPLYLRYLPAPKGHTLKFEAANAGAALSALGITNGMRGGKLTVNGQPTPKGGARDLAGSMTITNFTLVNAPVLGRLLNAMSLGGIVELLNGKGIAFKKMRAQFQWIDRGQPETAKNARLLRLKDGETSGASLGLTFEGNIDNWANTLDLDGTIIPVSDLNKVLDAIPLVGNILTGGGKGIFAATYTVKGPTDQPTVTVNPLAVLAPGILRKLFFEK